MPTTVKLRTHIAQVSLNAPALTRPSIGVAPFRGIHTQGYGAFQPQGPTHSRARALSRTHCWAKPCSAAWTTHSRTHRSQPPESDHDRTHGRSPLWRADPRRSYRSQRAETQPRPPCGRSPVWRPDPQRARLSTRSENHRGPRHGRSPVWRADPRRSYERSLPSRTLRVAARLGWSFLITP
jgi:hypothetical protein